MNYLRAVLAAVAPAALFLACSAGHNGSAAGGASTGSGGAGGGAAACPACVTNMDCAAGSKCGQFGGDAYCAPDCSMMQACSSDCTCTQVTGADGSQLQVCVPTTNVCGMGMATASASTGPGATSSSSGMPGEHCGALDGPDVMAACTSCKSAGKPCQANGCYGGWWCNVDTNSCQSPPNPASCGGSTSSASSSTSASSSSGGTGGGPVGSNGGTIPALNFAIVGDTRPANDNDTANYPKAVITKIWQDIEAVSPRPAFGVTTGDYMFAYATGNQSGPQLDIYLAARANFSNIVFPAMGNHECTGAVASNCGQGNSDGITVNYNSFMNKMLAPLGKSLPYYTIDINGTNNAWTAKFVFIACNAWNAAQSAWLSGELAKATKYTFIVRHEGSIATTGPCVTPSAQIMAQHPYTLLIAGHTHTYAYYASEKQIVVGNGGAPLSGGINYGYVIATQQANGSMLFREFDYSTNAQQQSFTVGP